MVPAGANLKLGMRDARVVVLRQRLEVTDPPPTRSFSTTTVDAAVKAFQKQAGLKPDGIVGQGTLGVLNAAADDHIATILANMERWRWMPRDLGRFYVRVNVPNFNLDVYQDGKVVYTTRIVVGKTGKQTPIFSDEIEHVIVNPTWNVPASIAVKEMLPSIQANPGALSGYQVFANVDGRFRAVDPYDGRLVDGRHAPHPDQAAAGRAQRARLDQVHVPQPLRRLPARHAVEELVPARLPRAEPRLHAGA